MKAINVNVGAGGVIALVALVGVVYVVWRGRQAAETLVTETLNPADANNIVNRNFNKLYRAVTGSDATLGSDIYDWLH